jgi:hypothetical protein
VAILVAWAAQTVRLGPLTLMGLGAIAFCGLLAVAG